MGPLSIFVAVVVAILLTLIVAGLCVRLCQRKAPALANVITSAQDLAWTWIHFPVSYKRQCSTTQQQLNNNVDTDKHALDSSGSDVSEKECPCDDVKSVKPGIFSVSIETDCEKVAKEDNSDPNTKKLSKLHEIV